MRLIAPTRVLGSKGRPAQQPHNEQRRGPHCPSERHPLVRGERRGPGLLPPRGARQPRDDPQAQHAAQDGADDAGGVAGSPRALLRHGRQGELSLFEHLLVGGLIDRAGLLQIVGLLEGADARARARLHDTIFGAARVAQIIERHLYPLDVIAPVPGTLLRREFCSSARTQSCHVPRESKRRTFPFQKTASSFATITERLL